MWPLLEKEVKVGGLGWVAGWGCAELVPASVRQPARGVLCAVSPLWRQLSAQLSCFSHQCAPLLMPPPPPPLPPCLPLQGNLTTRFMATCLMAVARGWRAAPRWLQVATSWPVKKLSGARGCAGQVCWGAVLPAGWLAGWVGGKNGTCPPACIPPSFSALASMAGCLHPTPHHPPLPWPPPPQASCAACWASACLCRARWRWSTTCP